MTSKLTLSIKPELISEAKRQAAEKHISVSAMFSDMVRSQARQKQQESELGPLSRKALGAAKRRRVRLGPISRKACGLLKLPKDKSYRDLLTEALMERYGLDK